MQWIKASERFPSIDKVCRKIGTVDILDSYDLLQADKRGFYKSSYHGRQQPFDKSEWEWLDESESTPAIEDVKQAASIFMKSLKYEGSWDSNQMVQMFLAGHSYCTPAIPSSIVRRLEESNPFAGGEEVQMKYGYMSAVSKLTELLSAQPAEQGEEKFYLYDEITNQLEEIASVDDAKNFIRENYIEGNSIHPDFSAFLILKEVGTVETIEENDEVKGIQIKLSNHNQQS